MPQSIYNIIRNARLDATDMESIQKNEANIKKLKDAFRDKWNQNTITDEDILEDLIDYNKSPDWIKEAIEEERCAIVHEIKSPN